ncbi:MAG: XRE family transcriptional regulator, partial [Alphaproteobacteria bacterium]|nr:XRE family transcriptional regulator [Alphaproteobacteria bacterium]
VDTFYEGLDQTGANVTNARQRLSLELVRSFGRINNPRHQEALAQMARALADSEEHAAAMAAE